MSNYDVIRKGGGSWQARENLGEPDREDDVGFSDIRCDECGEFLQDREINNPMTDRGILCDKCLGIGEVSKY